MGRLSELDEIKRQGLVPEKQAPERGPWEVAWEEWWERNKHVKFEASTLLLERMFHDGFEAGQAHARAELQAAAREVLPAEDPQGGELWLCRGCWRAVDASDVLEGPNLYGAADPYKVHMRERSDDKICCGPVVKV